MHWDWRWHQLDGVVVLLRAFENFGVENRNPAKNCNDNSLRAIAENKLIPRCPPVRERGKQVWFGRRGQHNQYQILFNASNTAQCKSLALPFERWEPGEG